MNLTLSISAFSLKYRSIPYKLYKAIRFPERFARMKDPSILRPISHIPDAKMYFNQTIELAYKTAKNHCDNFITMVFLPHKKV
jgi:hypothetical protein